MKFRNGVGPEFQDLNELEDKKAVWLEETFSNTQFTLNTI